MIDRRRTTAVLAAVGVLGLAACDADPKVLTSYTPAAGVSGESGTVKVQNLLLINGDGQARVSAAVISSKNDKVVGITGQPLKSDNSLAGQSFTVTSAGVNLPAHTSVNLTKSDLQAPVEGLSDGLLADLGHIAEESGFAIDVNTSVLDIEESVRTVGMATGMDPLDWVLAGGEDHALAATFAPGTVPEGWTVIGRVLPPDQVADPTVLVDGQPWQRERGWTHFHS